MTAQGRPVKSQNRQAVTRANMRVFNLSIGTGRYEFTPILTVDTNMLFVRNRRTLDGAALKLEGSRSFRPPISGAGSWPQKEQRGMLFECIGTAQ